MKSRQKLFLSTLLSFFLILFVSLVNAQERTISGTVTDKAGVPLPGVSIVVSGSITGAITNVDGVYSLNVPADATQLMFSFVGMTTQLIEIGDQTIIDAVMEKDAIGLEEVVVIGYGTARKKDLTGAIVNVQSEDLEIYKPQSVGEMLRYSVPGLQVYTTRRMPLSVRR